MSENEHLLNVYVAKNAPDSCADFMGFTVVKDIRDANDRRITPGKWLVRIALCHNNTMLAIRAHHHTSAMYR